METIEAKDIFNDEKTVTLICLVFATLVAQGIKTAQDCSPISPDGKTRLDGYMGGFKLDV